MREAFAINQNEESRRGVMLPPPSERLALVSVPLSERHHWPTHRDSGPFIGIDDKDKLHCDYNKRPRHIKETCWRLHGRPPSRERGGCLCSTGGRAGNSCAHHSTVVEHPPSSFESMAFSTSEIELLRSMSRLDTSIGTSSSFIHSGNFVRSGNSQSVSVFMSHSTLPRIIDFDASNHMTGQSNLFSFYTPYTVADKVKIVDGTFSSVFGKDLVHTTPSLLLSSILHVSNFITIFFIY